MPRTGMAAIGQGLSLADLPAIETKQASNSGEGEVKWRFGGWLVSEGKIVKGKFGRKKRIPPKSLLKVGKSFETQNRPLAEIILADQLTYFGLPVIWAKLFTKNHPPPAKKVAKVVEKQGSLF